MNLPDVSKLSVPLFADPATLSYEELNDPDYALKELAKLNQGKYTIGCSRCHHCR
jgi:hypothetical protein